MAQVQNKISRELLEAVDTTVHSSQQYLLSIQYSDGYWWGELESNPTMEAEYLLLSHFLGVGDQDRWRHIANYLLGKQREDGSWGQYFEAPGDVSTSVECYFALKLAGVSPDTTEMRKAREFILSKGGVPKVRVFTKIWLCLFGQWEWKGTPVMPPEVMFLPSWFPFNIYEFSSWARATIVPMLIILAKRPLVAVPEWARIDELYPLPRESTDYSLPKSGGLLSWARIFHACDKLFRLYQGMPVKPGRGAAIRKAVRWMVSHQEADGSWGGIQPPWVYCLIALKCLGYSMDHPVMKKGVCGVRGLRHPGGRHLAGPGLRLPCVGHVPGSDWPAGLRHGPRRPGCPESDALDVKGTDPCGWGLADTGQEHPAGWLGLRVRERYVSGRR